jgi:tetratricopeptide (TPR) repeat protein
MAHNNLGHALYGQEKVEEAIACFRQAIALDPKDSLAHYNLGYALYGKGKVDEAIACFRKAIALDPKHAGAHHNLGLTLWRKGQVDEAINCWRKAIALDPKFALPHFALGRELLQQGRFAHAQASTRRALDLLAPQDPLRQTASRQLQQCQRWLALEKQLPDVLSGKRTPASTAERLEYARLCVLTRRYRTSVLLYSGAFAADPKLVNDLSGRHRYNAACSAVLGGCGSDTGTLTATERLGLRRQALTWLRADLAQWKRLAARGEVGPSRLARALQHWQKDSDLAGIRDRDAVARLAAEEQHACRTLWAEVEALRNKAQGKTKGP